MNSEGGNHQKAGAVAFGGSQKAASANLWTAEDSLAAANVRLHYELEEANARVAVLEEEQRILKNAIEGLRDTLCSYKCADKASADGGWANI
jgi:hypothetical protein